jgi:hypothetical protein
LNAEDIGEEIHTQKILFKEANSEMEKVQNKMDAIMDKLGHLLKTNDAGTIKTIMILSCVLLVLIMVVLFL